MHDFNKFWIISTGFRNTSNINIHENPFGGSRVAAYGQTDGQTDTHNDIK